MGRGRAPEAPAPSFVRAGECQTAAGLAAWAAGCASPPAASPTARSSRAVADGEVLGAGDEGAQVDDAGRGAMRLHPGVHQQHLVDRGGRQRRARGLGGGQLGEHAGGGLLAERLAAHLALDDDAAGADAPEGDPAAPARGVDQREVVALRGAQAQHAAHYALRASRAGSAGAPPARRRAA